ncbi:hypothetical protein OK18_02015 [Chryseobacterium gallinarum]|uniref:Immunity MXAN-0049 protein domain-containing protein n=1 Tax=Chryseobacterium gallinarum TaxID=1324352 RepID=A0A0G3M3J0_CHRGL|nr:DUF1629 domain-containing protein [Chryseobacterium gallinarum]AKK71577.1 hypothetical protein OK18_02015 [Chryseobacterium gallinarum]
MKYYKINFTLNTKLRGNDNFIKDYKLKIPTGKLFWEEPKFIGNVYNEKIDFEPYLVDIELFANSKITDLIMDGGVVSSKLILSGKLKSIIEKYRKTGIQFFNINIIKKNETYNDYWLLNLYELNQEYIDFANSKIVYSKKKVGGGTEQVILKINSLRDFEDYVHKAKEKLEIITIEKLALYENIIVEDFFALKYVTGGLGYYVSEKLKNDIEQAGCTGIEFQPSELSYNEWVIPGGVREQIYGKI